MCQSAVNRHVSNVLTEIVMFPFLFQVYLSDRHSWLTRYRPFISIMTEVRTRSWSARGKNSSKQIRVSFGSISICHFQIENVRICFRFNIKLPMSKSYLTHYLSNTIAPCGPYEELCSLVLQLITRCQHAV